MTIYDLNEYKQNTKTYGGTAGVKVGLTINKKDYLIKYPGKLKDRNLKNIELSYSNSPVCEYIGCKIYESIGIDTQNVYLGTRNNKIVVMCEDFLKQGDFLVPFKDIRATFEPVITDPQGDITNGTGTVLSNILRTLEEHPLCQKVPELKDRFWDMFVVDSLIGNPDRNNENWGLIRDKNNNYRLSPVFDCGNCLNNKLSEAQMINYLNNEVTLNDLAINRPCIYEKIENKRISSYKFIKETKNVDCNRAVLRVVPKINMEKIKNIINEIPNNVITTTMKDFYIKVIEERYDKVLQVTLSNIQQKEVEFNEESKSKIIAGKFEINSENTIVYADDNKLYILQNNGLNWNCDNCSNEKSQNLYIEGKSKCNVKASFILTEHNWNIDGNSIKEISQDKEIDSKDVSDKHGDGKTPDGGHGDDGDDLRS